MQIEWGVLAGKDLRGKIGEPTKANSRGMPLEVEIKNYHHADFVEQLGIRKTSVGQSSERALTVEEMSIR